MKMTKSAMELLMDWAMTHSVEEQRKFAEFYTNTVKSGDVVAVKDMAQLLRDFMHSK